jgi:hypothetical protein
MLTIGLRGWRTEIPGEIIDERRWFPGFFRRLFGKRHHRVTTKDGHVILVRKNEVVLVEHTPQAEIDKKEADAKAAAETQQKAQVEALDRAAKKFIEQHGPNPGRWPRLWTPADGH